MGKEKRLLFGTSLKDFNIWDVALMKLAIISFTLFAITIWPSFQTWVISTSWKWFLVAWIVFAIKPLMIAWK